MSGGLFFYSQIAGVNQSRWEKYMRKVAKYELCSSCSNIKFLDGDTIGDYLDGKGAGKVYSLPLGPGHLFANDTILKTLMKEGGCSKCINLFMQACR
jgi:hypothetical protein